MIANGSVLPRRLTNAARRLRECLTPAEVERLIAAAKALPGRHGHRDANMILITYRHSLRVEARRAVDPGSRRERGGYHRD